MLNKNKNEENSFLENLKKDLNDEYRITEALIGEDSENIHDIKKYMWQNAYELDSAEVRANRQMVDSMVNAAQRHRQKLEGIRKMLNSPYFGRINFIFDDDELGIAIARGSIIDNEGSHNIYIGIHSYAKENKNIIYDWRAPICSMFYDCETGEARFYAPKGEISGKITLKRQYKITDGQMEYMLESSLKIDDDILQEQLSKASSDKMKNIVATIQKEQNSVIRDETTGVLIIQGAAGSGKTSIALHRAAYLLYRMKNRIHSENMMIISPNKIFSDYISNVLPELGEERILQITFNDMAEHELRDICEYETFYDQIDYLLEHKDEILIKRIEYKSSLEFLSRLQEYVEYITDNNFNPAPIVYEYNERNIEISEKYIRDRYNAYKRFPMSKRVDMIFEDIIDRIITDYNIPKGKMKTASIRRALNKMLEESDLLKLYGNFYKFTNMKNMYVVRKKRCLLYEDIAPLLYLKNALFGTDDFIYVKHLLIDEMQDYTPVHYALWNKLFNCRKTILGDIHQLLNPYNRASSHADISELFAKYTQMNVKVIKLCKSYRSTFEISEFACSIIKNDNLEIVERHGDTPVIIKCKDQISAICEQVIGFKQSRYKSFGIICKTIRQAEELFKDLKKFINELVLLSASSSEFSNDFVITTSYLSKGLEFDWVVIPMTDKNNYSDEIDRQMLYIGVTRALHKLSLLYSENFTELIRGSYE